MSSQILLTLIAVLLAGCNGATAVNSEVAATTSTANTPAVLELRFDETQHYQGLRLHLLKIEDSRCPTGLTCVWAGQMLAVISVARGTDDAIEVSLRTRVGSEPELSTALGYEFSLLSLEPHPKNNVTISRSEQSLRLMINKL
ncbi:hypothetical protein [Woeseia oceani]|uniref:Lipoprotein n=1 Tax=Woeseia oceani TaxID=1548547 RepID=A0A193LFC7_9GAMM|nr:hypothetical protein [Woeseia oceani]ANO51168.1 hypothetical protein BA177_08090 [Woeseia oceani]